MRKKLLVVMITFLLTVIVSACGMQETEVITENVKEESTTDVEDDEVAETVEIPEEDGEEENTETVKKNEISEPANDEDTKAGQEEVVLQEEVVEEVLPEYTYTDSSSTMYAKSEVNVRDLPSTDGERIGGLAYNQEITVTGSCNETGWYRIDYNGLTGYVSNSYLVAEKIVVVEEDEFVPEEGMVFIEIPTYVSPVTQQDDKQSNAQEVSATQTDREMSEAIFNLINADRAASGIAQLTWNENLYNLAAVRCSENDGHAGFRDCNGENYAAGFYKVDRIHNAFKNSPDHYECYMSSRFTTGAVCYTNGVTYELFNE